MCLFVCLFVVSKVFSMTIITFVTRDPLKLAPHNALSIPLVVVRLSVFLFVCLFVCNI